MNKVVILSFFRDSLQFLQISYEIDKMNGHYGKGKRKVHLNFCQHLFLKLSELTFISNQEISINPFLSEK